MTITRKRVLIGTTTVALLAGAALAARALGGPIAAPSRVTELAANPCAFQEQFDRAAGAPRLVLLLSPA